MLVPIGLSNPSARASSTVATALLINIAADTLKEATNHLTDVKAETAAPMATANAT
jgi:hypothetical protein